jgi:hypothetical protein
MTQLKNAGDWIDYTGDTKPDRLRDDEMVEVELYSDSQPPAPRAASNWNWRVPHKMRGVIRRYRAESDSAVYLPSEVAPIAAYEEVARRVGCGVDFAVSWHKNPKCCLTQTLAASLIAKHEPECLRDPLHDMAVELCGAAYGDGRAWRDGAVDSMIAKMRELGIKP